MVVHTCAHGESFHTIHTDIDSALTKIDEVASNQEGIAAEEALVLRGYVHFAPHHYYALLSVALDLSQDNWNSTKMCWSSSMPASRLSLLTAIRATRCDHLPACIIGRTADRKYL